jgi:hypothetical protein
MLVRYPDSSYMKREFITAHGDESKVFVVAPKVIAVEKAESSRRQKNQK